MASSSSKRKGRNRSPWVRRLKLTITLVLALLFVGFISLFGLFALKYREAEQAMGSLGTRMAEVNRGPSKILTADGQVLFQISEENRIPLKLNQIPKMVRNAVLAAEDKRFYDHGGVDGLGLLRAFSTIFRDGHVAQGGSTITMQLAKRLYSGSEKSFMRKVQDIAFATAMEREIVNKDRILELYLNQVYFGQGAHGIGAAARVYFNKTVDQLDLSEAAMLARCVRLPSKQNPVQNLELAVRNRDVVLGIMREENMVTQAEYEAALAETPKLNPNPDTTSASFPLGYGKHFKSHVMAFLASENVGIDLKRGGYTVYTTLDSQLQKLAEKSVRDVVAANRGRKVTEGAFLATDSDGRILAEVGGIDYDKNEFNIVTQGQLQPGSAFKAIVYSAALKDGILTSPSDYVSNARVHDYDPTTGKSWDPENSSRRENAPGYSLKTAFALSVNLPAINTSFKVGFDRIAELARDAFGFRSKIAPYKSIALGVNEVTPLEMAEAYSVFMLRGDRVRPYPVTRVVGSDGELVKSFVPQRFSYVLEPQVCETMDELLRAVVEEGTASKVLRESVPNARGKTGTTNSAKDAWFCGYTDGVIGIGWVGNQQRQANGQYKQLPMSSSVYGGTVTTYIWRDIMKVARQRFGSSFVPNQNDPKTTNLDPPRQKRSRDASGDDVKDPNLEADTPDEPATDTDGNPVQPPSARADSGPKPTEGSESGTKQKPLRDGDMPRKRAKDSDPVIGEPEKTDAEKALEEPKPPRSETTEPDPVKSSASRRNDESRRPPKSSEAETVTVEICVDSGRIATTYCKETVSRTFPIGKQPKGKCRIHGTGKE